MGGHYGSSNNKQSLYKSASTIVGGYLIANFVNFLKSIVIFRIFGTSLEIDAFYAANRIADLIFNIVAGGALISSFVPIFTKLLSQDKKRLAWETASSIINWTFLFSICFSLLAAIFSPWIIQHILAPGFVDDPYQFQLTIKLMRINLLSVSVFSISGLLMGILNSYNKFFLPALAPAFYSIGQIFGAVVLSPLIGISGLAWGVVIGACLHLLIQIPSLFQLNWKYSFQSGRKNPNVSEIIILLFPRLIGAAIVQINFLVNTNLASQFGDGFIVGIQGGFTLVLIPVNLFAQSIATVSLPIFSKQFSINDKDGFYNTFTSALNTILFLTIPASTGIIILRYPLIRVLYENGINFTKTSTELVAWALLWYALGLVAHSTLEIIVRTFYAQRNTKTPVIIGTMAMLINILLSIVLSKVFASIGWMPHGGLALANSIATTIETFVLLLLLKKKWKSLQNHHVFRVALLSIIATLVMGFSLHIFLSYTNEYPDIFQLFGGIILGSLVYIGLAFLLKIKDFRAIIHQFSNKIKDS